ncbi:MAG: hypothetical protein ACK4TA_11085 [Saprospiraceae bacterium]
MRSLTLLLIIICSFATACQQKATNNTTEAPAADASAAPELADGSYCYQYAVGRDTTYVNLIVNGNDVSGEMNWTPYEKDGAYGTLQGTRNGNEIAASWTYTIEGSNQTEAVLFKVEGDHLMRKVGELEDPNNDGNLKMKDPASATYSEHYTKVTCP